MDRSDIVWAEAQDGAQTHGNGASLWNISNVIPRQILQGAAAHEVVPPIAYSTASFHV